MLESMVIYLALFAFGGLSFAKVRIQQEVPVSPANDERCRTLPSFWILYAMLVSIIVGLRYEVGNDYTSYVQIYDRLADAGLSLSVEPGYALLNLVSAGVQGGPRLVFLVSAVVTDFLILCTIRRYSVNGPISVFALFGMGFFFFHLSGVRQAIAIAIVFYAFRYLDARQGLPYVLLMLLAAMFHWLALLGLAAYWLSEKRAPHVVLIVLAALSVGALYIMPVRRLAVSLIEIISPTRYAHLFIGLWMKPSRVNRGYFVFLQVMFLCALVVFYPRLWRDWPATHRRILNITVYGYILFFFIAHFDSINRIAFFFKMYEILLFPIVISKFKYVPIRYVVGYGFFVVFLVMTVYQVCNNSYSSVPYSLAIRW